MAQLKILRPFHFAHGGHTVVVYEAGQEVTTDDDELVRVAVGEGWAKDAAALRSNKSKGNAPENK